MRVCVTGANGHVGGAIASYLTAAGHEVVGLGRDPGGATRAVHEMISDDIARPGLAGRLVSERLRCQAIVHAAASLARSPYDVSLSATNGGGTQQLLELAQQWGVVSFVYMSSLPVIGTPTERPVTERHPVRPATAYHASKLYAEHLLEVCHRLGTPTLSLRLTSPVGPHMPRDRILPTFVQRALAGEPLEVLGSGQRGQDYVHVADVAAAVAASLSTRATGLLNVASGSCVSNLELARMCVEVLGSSSPVELTGQPDPEEGTYWEVSIAKAMSTIGYEPRYSLQESIVQLAQSLRSAPDA